jgi:hypothetical protein
MKREWYCLLLIILLVVSVSAAEGGFGGGDNAVVPGDTAGGGYDEQDWNEPTENNGGVPYKKQPEMWAGASPEQQKTIEVQDLVGASEDIVKQIWDNLDPASQQNQYVSQRMGVGADLEGNTQWLQEGQILRRQYGEAEADLESLRGSGQNWEVSETPEGLRAEMPEGSLEYDTGRLEAPQGGPLQAGGGGGGQQAGGGAEGLFEKALSVVQQIMGILKEIASAVKGGSNGEGQTRVDAKANGDVEIGLDDGAEMAIEDEEEDKEVVLGQDDEEGEESITTLKDGELDEMIAESNTEIIIPEQVEITIPAGTDPTTIINEGTETDELGGVIPITGLAIADSSRQYVRLIEHNLGLGGEKIIVNVLKSFDEVEGDGSTLWIENGENKLRFDEKRIFYPRVVVNTPHNFKEIRNKNDERNYFILQGYEEGKRYLVDGEKRISVGYLMTDHPRLEGLRIAQLRSHMWVER